MKIKFENINNPEIIYLDSFEDDRFNMIGFFFSKEENMYYVDLKIVHHHIPYSQCAEFFGRSVESPYRGNRTWINPLSVCDVIQKALVIYNRDRNIQEIVEIE
jgi:hypothetical protein